MNDPKKLVTDVFTSLAKGNGEVAEMSSADDFQSTVLNSPVDKKQYIQSHDLLQEIR